MAGTRLAVLPSCVLPPRRRGFRLVHTLHNRGRLWLKVPASTVSSLSRDLGGHVRSRQLAWKDEGHGVCPQPGHSLAPKARASAACCPPRYENPASGALALLNISLKGTRRPPCREETASPASAAVPAPHP